jgi:hypothetical protein
LAAVVLTLFKGGLRKVTISRESYLILAICCADLASTIYLVNYQNACEGNPLMSYYLQQGIGMFIVMKLVLCVLPLFLVEYARRFRPRFATIGLRAVISGYLLAYLGGIVILNSNILENISDMQRQQGPMAFKNVRVLKVARLAGNPALGY